MFDEDDPLDGAFALLIRPNDIGKDGLPTTLTTAFYLPQDYPEDTTKLLTNSIYILAAAFERMETDEAFADDCIKYAKKLDKKRMKAHKKRMKAEEELPKVKALPVVSLDAIKKLREEKES